MNGFNRLGELMLAKGLVTAEQLEEAAALRYYSKLRFADVLVRHGFASAMDVASCLGELYDLPVVDPLRLNPTPAALALISYEEARSSLFLPVDLTDEWIAAALADPIDLELPDALALRVKRKKKLAISAPNAILQAIDRWYRPSGLDSADLSHVA
ncbi:MAG TPA: hypothetical protein VMI31_04715 [Fimbriimonadaceae bacterium]|nr:hypothetical protein [Fimbriimonadaceae bacterium]